MTNFDKKEFIRGVINGFSLTFLTLLLLLVMCGCKTQYVPVPEYHLETVRTDTAIYNAILRTFRESVLSRQQSSDSLTHILKETTTLNEQGDTTKHDKTEYIYMSSQKETEYNQIIKEQRDSIGILNARLESVKADSVPVPYPVERELTRWEKTKMDFGGAAIWGLGGALIAIGILAWLARKRR